MILSYVQVLSEQIISNESRIAKTKVIVNFNKPRQMAFTFLVRFEDFSKVEAICTDMKDHLLNTEGIQRQLPMWVGFTGVDHGACNIYTIVSPAFLAHSIVLPSASPCDYTIADACLGSCPCVLQQSEQWCCLQCTVQPLTE